MLRRVCLALFLLSASILWAADDQPSKTVPKLDPKETWTKLNEPDWVGKPVAAEDSAFVAETETSLRKGVNASSWEAISLKHHTAIIRTDWWDGMRPEIREFHVKRLSLYFKARGGELKARIYASGGQKLLAYYPPTEADRKQEAEAKAKQEAASKVLKEAAEKAAKEKAAKDAEEAKRLAVEKTEQGAAARLKVAKMLLGNGQKDKAIDRLKMLLKDYPQTKAATEAKELLKKLGQ